MRLFHSPNSPYVRKVLIVAHELGLMGRITLQNAAPHPVNRDASVVASNPLGKIPTAVLDDGAVIYDSRVVAEYLASLTGDETIFPKAGAARWLALTEQALGDGITDAAQLIRYERTIRPAEQQSEAWIKGQAEKIRSGIAEIEKRADRLRWSIGGISIACALGYLDLRLPDVKWRDEAPATAKWFAACSARPSMQATVPPG